MNGPQPRRIKALPPQDMAGSQYERILDTTFKLAIIGIACAVLLMVFQAGQVILAPVFLAIVIGLMFGPVADMIERLGVPPALSAGLVVLLLLGVIVVGVLLFAVPLSGWVARVPAIWDKFRTELTNLKQPLASIAALQEQVKAIFGPSTAMSVRVEDGSAVTNIAFIAPAIGAQILIFLASLYFYLATRAHIRVSILSLCVTRRMRWRTAHVFRDVEIKVSRFLLSVTMINICVGVVVALAMWAIGMPSPILWGGMAMVLNYIPYVGQAVMVVVLVSVGLATQSELSKILLPVGCYLAINFVEGQIVTPHFLGRTMTINPFLIFLSITFWLWVWGPVGGLVAVPSLLIVQSLLIHIVPSKPVVLRRPVRRTREMSDNDVVLATAAAGIREQLESQKAPDRASLRQDKRMRPPKGTSPDGAIEPN